jgi:hypothetical protein
MSTVLKKGTIKRIHVNRQNLSKMARGTAPCPIPVLSVQTSKGVIQGFTSVQILGTSTLMFPGKQLHCGARVWIETKAEVIVD